MAPLVTGNLLGTFRRETCSDFVPPLQSRDTLTLLWPPQTLQKEIGGHRSRVDDILERGRHLPKDGDAGRRASELLLLWRRLTEEAELRRDRLDEAYEAQRFYSDADEAEAWMSEQELYMMSEEKAKVSVKAQSRASPKSPVG